jgi:SIR2-like domain
MTKLPNVTSKQAEHAHDGHEDVAACPLCASNHSFRMPPAIVEAAVKGRLVVFAGAGISTESSSVYPDSFYDEMKSWLSSTPEDDSFPAVMSAVEAEIGRVRLVEEAIGRIKYVTTFPFLAQMATRFHQELATIPQISEVITTNWDPFFEDVCGMIPIVVDGDYSFYNLPGRKVYKIHGSISIVSTMIATLADYQRREKELRESVIGGTLRHLLGTKIVIFIGYSLKDDDFRNVYEPLMGGMGQLRPVAYVVSPFDAPEAEELGLRHIKTDGAYFMRELRKKLVSDGHNLPDNAIEKVFKLRTAARKCHELTEQMNWREHPELVFSLAYQDGLLDAFGRIISQYHTGEYSNIGHLLHIIRGYSRLLATAVARKRYWDAAYIDGFCDALHLPLYNDDEMRDFLLYEMFNEDDFPTTVEDESDVEENDKEDAVDTTNDDDDDDDEEEEDSIADDDVRREASENPDAGADNSDEDSPRPQALAIFLDEEELLEALGNVDDCLPDMVAEGRRIVETLGRDEGIPHHTPFLYGVEDPEPAPSILP